MSSCAVCWSNGQGADERDEADEYKYSCCFHGYLLLVFA